MSRRLYGHPGAFVAYAENGKNEGIFQSFLFT